MDDTRHSSSSAAPPELHPYHEKQSLRVNGHQSMTRSHMTRNVDPAMHRCALHSINNLFQSSLYNVADLDRIALQWDTRSYNNEYKSIWGIGNYDFRVLEEALTMNGYTAILYDRDQPISSIDYTKLFGIICHIKQPGFLHLYQSQHWYSVKPFTITSPSSLSSSTSVSPIYWYDLNSQLDVPLFIPDIRVYLSHLLDKPETRLFFVVKAGTDASQIYLNAANPHNNNNNQDRHDQSNDNHDSDHNASGNDNNHHNTDNISNIDRVTNAVQTEQKDHGHNNTVGPPDSVL